MAEDGSVVSGWFTIPFLAKSWFDDLGLSTSDSTLDPLSFHFVCLFVLFCFFLFFLLFRTTPMAYGSSQARGWIRAPAASLRPQTQQHGIRAVSATDSIAHSNAGSFNPQSEATEQTHVLMDTSWVCYHWAKMGTLVLFLTSRFNPSVGVFMDNVVMKSLFLYFLHIVSVL